jgi:hypothetical protein
MKARVRAWHWPPEEPLSSARLCSASSASAACYNAYHTPPDRRKASKNAQILSPAAPTPDRRNFQCHKHMENIDLFEMFRLAETVSKALK